MKGRFQFRAGAPWQRVLPALLACALFGLPLAMAAEGPDQRAAAYADKAYTAGRYGSALKTYLRLAKKGDPFAQYRSSYMHLVGEGVDPDTLTAYAWAVLAAESGNPHLVAYLEQVTARVPDAQRKEANRLADDYMREWGRVALAIEARRKAIRELRSCTGSYLGKRCEEVYAVQMPKAFSIQPGDGSGADGGSASRSGTVSAATGGAGGAVRDVEHYQELRAYAAELDRFIEQNAGTVEVRELGVQEPEAAEASPAAPDEADPDQAAGKNGTDR